MHSPLTSLCQMIPGERRCFLATAKRDRGDGDGGGGCLHPPTARCPRPAPGKRVPAQAERAGCTYNVSALTAAAFLFKTLPWLYAQYKRSGFAEST